MHVTLDFLIYTPSVFSGGNIQMKLNIIMILNTVVTGTYGVAFVLAPAQVNMLYGTMTTDAQLAFMCQLFGAGFIGWAVLTWLARNATASDTRDAIVFALFVGSTIGFIVATMGSGLAMGVRRLYSQLVRRLPDLQQRSYRERLDSVVRPLWEEARENLPPGDVRRLRHRLVRDYPESSLQRSLLRLFRIEMLHNHCRCTNTVHGHTKPNRRRVVKWCRRQVHRVLINTVATAQYSHHQRAGRSDLSHT